MKICRVGSAWIPELRRRLIRSRSQRPAQAFAAGKSVGKINREGEQKSPSQSMTWAFDLAERVSALSDCHAGMAWDDLNPSKHCFQRENYAQSTRYVAY